jgi:hypothetical protein
LEVTASLYQAHARWMTATYLNLELSGLERDWMPISARLDLASEDAVALGRFLTDLAQIGEDEQAARMQAYLSALSSRVGGR